MQRNVMHSIFMLFLILQVFLKFYLTIALLSELHNEAVFFSGNNGEDILKEPVLYECFKNDLEKEYRRKEHELSERSPSPLDEAATKIQAAFRGHIVRANPEKFGLDKKQADIIRRRSTEHINLLDTRKDLKRHSVGGYALERDTPEDRAATKIQAEIRGFLTRRHVQQMKKEGDEAAKKIQAHIRGYLTRKHLDEAGIPRKHSVVSSSHSHEDLQKHL